MLVSAVGARGQVYEEAYKEDNTAQVTGDLEMALGHLLTEGNDDGASGTSYGLALALEQANWVEGVCTESVDDVAAEETSGTENGSGMALVVS